MVSNDLTLYIGCYETIDRAVAQYGATFIEE